MYGKLDDHLPSDFYDKSLVFAIDGCTHSDNPMLAVASSAEWRFGSYESRYRRSPRSLMRQNSLKLNACV